MAFPERTKKLNQNNKHSVLRLFPFPIEQVGGVLFYRGHDAARVRGGVRKGAREGAEAEGAGGENGSAENRTGEHVLELSHS